MSRVFFASLAVFVCVASARAQSIDSAAWNRIFLTQAELPGLQHGQDGRWRDPDESDSLFMAFHGIQSGMNVWNAGLDSMSANAWTRVVDIHWLFPDSATARAYFERSLQENSEGAPEIVWATKLADQSHAFGGTLDLGGFKMRNYYYLFVQGRVVTKLFLNQSNNYADPTRFGVDNAYEVARNLAERVRQSRI